MRRKHAVADRVYNDIFPQPSEQDPQNWSQHLSRNLVAEVRLETHRFYGSLDTVEAKYPGLNYTFAAHIKRLSYWPHHRRLFETFNHLGLTAQEILTLCRWEGTLWARQRYEQDEGIKVEDTTGNEIKRWRPKPEAPLDHNSKVARIRERERHPLREQQPRIPFLNQQQVTATNEHVPPTTNPLSFQLQTAVAARATVEQSLARTGTSGSTARDVEMRDGQEAELHITQAEAGSHTMSASEAFRRMQLLAAMRQRGETLEAIDPDFEQYFKDSLEEQGVVDPSNVMGDLPAGYQAAHTIASVMNTVAQTQALPPPSSESSRSNGRLVSTRAPEVDAR